MSLLGRGDTCGTIGKAGGSSAGGKQPSECPGTAGSDTFQRCVRRVPLPAGGTSSAGAGLLLGESKLNLLLEPQA